MKKSLAITLGVVALIVIIAAVAYFSFQRKIVFSQVSHNDWKTYVNDSVGYSIQYPSNVLFWEDASAPNNMNLRNVDLVFGNDAKGIRISALVKDVNWAESEICSKSKRTAVIDDMEWEKSNCKIGYMDVPPDLLEVYSRDAGDFVQKIQLNYGKDKSKEEQEFMESIISTFKFVEKSNVVKETSTYTSDKLKVSFEYPADWRLGEGLDQVVVDRNSPNGTLRFDLYKFDATAGTDLKDVGGCKIIESSGVAELSCADDSLPEYIIRYGNNGYKLEFSKRSHEVADPKNEVEFNRLTAEMFAKNAGSFQKILASVRFMK
jgi:hypothetical protein